MNPNYLKKEYFDFIRTSGIRHVLLQGYYMPPIWEIREAMQDAIMATSVIRLLGPDRKGIEERTGKIWNRIVDPRDEEIRKITDMITDLTNRNINIYLNVNNHFEGCAPLTIEEFRGLLPS